MKRQNRAVKRQHMEIIVSTTLQISMFYCVEEVLVNDINIHTVVGLITLNCPHHPSTPLL